MKCHAVLIFAVMSPKYGIFCIGLNGKSARVHLQFCILIIVECTRCTKVINKLNKVFLRPYKLQNFSYTSCLCKLKAMVAEKGQPHPLSTHVKPPAVVTYRTRQLICHTWQLKCCARLMVNSNRQQLYFFRSRQLICRPRQLVCRARLMGNSAVVFFPRAAYKTTVCACHARALQPGHTPLTRYTSNYLSHPMKTRMSISRILIDHYNTTAGHGGLNFP